MSIRLLICAEHPVVQAGLRAIFAPESDILITDEATTARAARQRADAILAGSLGCALQLVDLLLGSTPREAGRAGVITLITPEDEDRVLAALRAGVRGMVDRNARPAELVRAVRFVAAGQAWLPPTVTRQLLDWSAGVSSPDGEAPATVSALTSSELRVLRLLAEGMDGDQMARVLGITQATVRSHVHHMLTKLGLRSRSQAVAFAYRHGILSSWGSPGG